ncbi:MAG: shikimate dehydrogenase [Thaumarchaeota archaeon]|nr:shikimate dehydrogenase [Nitrososphaerota archaeon]
MTDQYYLIGERVSASPTPGMFNAAFENAGVDAEYSAVSVATEQLSAQFSSLKSKGAKGFNITIPFKTTVIPLLDGLDGTSAKIGAVNTVKEAGRAYFGYNTDVYGITRSLELHEKTEAEKALLIGAGGAARAFCEVADEIGCRSITVAVREATRAAKFIDMMTAAFPETEFELCSIDSLRGGDFDLVFNASPIGSAGIPLPDSLRRVLMGDMLVFDAVYYPAETELLAAAASKGSQTIAGYQMLLHQAVASFEIWTGQRPSEQVMERVFLDTIRRNER